MVPVGKWIGKQGGSIACPVCLALIQTQKHCLWDFPQAQRVWDRVTRLLVAFEEEGTTSWSAVAWINPLANSWTNAFNRHMVLCMHKG